MIRCLQFFLTSITSYSVELNPNYEFHGRYP